MMMKTMMMMKAISGSNQDEGNDSDMGDTDNAHIPKVLTTTWFKPILESERPATPEPEWTISPNEFSRTKHDWAKAYGHQRIKFPEKQASKEDYDIGSFIKWFCRRTGKKKLCKADLEGPAFNLVKAFHKNTSDGTLTRVLEKLEHMVKDFHLFEYNKGMETRKWSEDDKRISKDFITAIEKRLQIRRSIE
ncbi:hypothetical protein Tco_1317118 [Tanacetum coccineum]